MPHIRQATEADIPRMLEIYRSAREYMAKNGNPTQWGQNHPDVDILKHDIVKGESFLICNGEEIHGVFAMCAGIEPNYVHIEGDWCNEEPYVCIHRIASDGVLRNLFGTVFDFCRQHTDNVRIDTHESNTSMRRQIAAHGFRYCGIIYVGDGTPRLAYHWVREERQQGKHDAVYR